SARGIGVVARRGEMTDEPRLLEAPAQRRSRIERPQQKLFQPTGALLQVLGPADGPDAGAIARQRHDPDPPLAEAVDADVAGVLTGTTRHATEMREDRGAAVSRMTPLEPQLISQQCIAAARVHDVGGAQQLRSRPGL